ncbi:MULTISPECIES: fimbrial biogenesis chaperone [Enterobacteriaceae]|uniref:fimbrial biogenesis chaperone n=1 Tax=Enterobacteriaceae TaxID=543 RepID=UPI0013E0C663|nr:MULTISPECIES: molecular chaperone [Enterobacteriaceae]MEB2472316.1 molecular chaperone [Escherichia coli]UVY98687.1 hypothetical protein [Citrobacter freundii]HCA4490492.1 molecular chaperone [Escherichia coli]HCA4585357.1 molecular chaperone [Escherichia coli]
MIRNVIFIFIFIFSNSAFSNSKGISLDVSRAIFDEANNSISITAKNTSEDMVLLLKAYVSNYYTDSEEKVPFFITPPLNRIDPESSVQFRINKLDEVELLPKDRESIFSINVLAIPPKKKGVYIQMALNTKIKLIYRPKEINNQKEVGRIIDRISIVKNGEDITFYNPTPYFATIGRMVINNIPSNKTVMIKPFSNESITEKNASSISYSLINDFGGMSNEKKVIF